MAKKVLRELSLVVVYFLWEVRTDIDENGLRRETHVKKALLVRIWCERGVLHAPAKKLDWQCVAGPKKKKRARAM
uniref:Uncharacterized protein n=1 Tax=Candidozyma auris TaxID=498019 RepID=A0A0L0NX85_CANAR